MCGIFGWIGCNIDTNRAVLMRDRLSHRGPDDAGEWHDKEKGIWFGHRRLAILDPSPAGRQPMVSRSGRYVIVFNGEVFNFTELRSELEDRGSIFTGYSDTEVMLAAFDTWGVKKSLERFVGMFAFGVWDREQKTLMLVRDRMGIKPLYWTAENGQIAFASEMHALAHLPWVSQDIDFEALADYFRYLCVPATKTILSNVKKLLPGTLMIWRDGDFTIESYWDLKKVVKDGVESPLKMTRREAADELESRLSDSIALRMRSDVPYGAFLSGGIDSSLVAALMQKRTDQPIDTFTVGFSDSSNDESVHARAVAKHLGTKHHEETLNVNTVPNLVDEMVTLFDEPFADGSSFPTYLLCRFARRHVTVALSGDGGDELYGGYPRYFWANRIQRWRSRLGNFGTRLLKRTLRTIPDKFLDGPVNRMLNGKYAGSNGLSARVQRFAEYLATDPRRSDSEIIAAWPDPSAIMLQGPIPAADRYADWEMLEWAEQMMAVDQKHYLPNDILTKVDRTSMAVSMEVRVPMLDHRLVEWSWRLPRSLKMSDSGDRGKLLLRDVLYRYVPKELFERPKMGFGMPMDRWLRGTLKSWAEDILMDSSIKKNGILNHEIVQRIWKRHLEGENRLLQVWTVLMFHVWHERWKQSSSNLGAEQYN